MANHQVVGGLITGFEIDIIISLSKLNNDKSKQKNTS